MLKTLFRKYLFVTLLIVMVSFVFLGTVMIVFISRYWQTEKRSLLLQDAYSVAQIAGDSLISVEDNQYMVDTEKISGFISAFSTNIDADIMMKATMVDGVYDCDPKKNPEAKKYETLTFTEVLSQNLQVMDGTAASLCRDNKLPILVFSLEDPNNIVKAVSGEPIGTVVKEEE